MTPRWPVTLLLLGHMCDPTQGSFNPSSMKIRQSMWIYSDHFFEKTWIKGHWPLDDLWPKSVEVMWDFKQGSFFQVLWKYIEVCGYNEPFFSKLEPKVTDP